MTIDVGQGFVDILPRTDKFLTSLNSQVSKAVGDATKTATTTSQKLSNAAVAGMVALGAAAVTAIGKAIAVTQDWAGDVRALQKVTGQTAESASGLLGAAEQLGIGVDKLSVGFGVLAKNIVAGAPNLERYGIAVEDAQGNTLGFDTILNNVATTFNTLPAGIEQTAFAMNVFGRSGKELIPLLKRGADGIELLKDRAVELGLVMSQEDLDATKELAFAQRELGLAFKGAGIALGKTFIPALTRGVQLIERVVETVSRIPAPVLVGAFAFTALTGAVAAAFKVGDFFSSTWRNVLDTLDTGVSSVDASASALETLNTAATATTATTALQAQTVVMANLERTVAALAAQLGVQLPAAQVKAAASAKAANVVWAQQLAQFNALAAGAGKAGAAGAVTTLASAAVPLVAVLGTVALAFKLSADAARSTEEQIQRVVAAVQTGVRSIPQLRAEIAALRAGEGTLNPEGELVQFITNPSVKGPGFGAGFGFGKAQTDAKALEEAIRRVEEQQSLLGQSTAALTAGFRRELSAVTDLTTPLNEVGSATDRLNILLQHTQAGLSRFSQVSGVDASSIVANIAKVVNDPKATIEDTLAAYRQGLAETRAAWDDWHDTIVDNLGGAGAALDEFLGKQNVSFARLKGSLEDQSKALRQFGQDFAEVSEKGGRAAQEFLQFVSENGLDAAGALEAVADKPRKIQQRFLENFSKVEGQTEDLATSMQKALDPVFQKVILQLKNVVRAINGLPPLKLNADKAFGTLATLKARINELTGSHQINLDLGTHGSGGRVLAQGGVIAGASGFVTQGPTFLTGESNRMTFAGRGAEAVIPFDDRGIGILSEALRRAIDKGGVKGGDGGETVIHVHQYLDGKQVAESVTRHQQRGRMVRG